jgi:hypothetical protein
MSMGLEYVSELRLPTGLLFIPQVIYEHGESWWNDTDREKSSFDHQRPLEILTSHLVAKQEELAKKIINFAFAKYLFHTSKRSLTCRKILRHGADGFTSPPKEGVLRIFITLKNASPSAELEPANLGSNGKHANHLLPRTTFVNILHTFKMKDQSMQNKILPEDVFWDVVQYPRRYIHTRRRENLKFHL